MSSEQQQVVCLQKILERRMASTFRRRQRPSSTASSSLTDGVDSQVVVDGNTAPTPTPLQPLQLAGTKIWTAGCSLVSTGLRELDAILLASKGGSSSGGGQPLGSCIYLESDHWSILSDDFVRYWCAEALSQEQALLVPMEDSTSLVDVNDWMATSSWLNETSGGTASSRYSASSFAAEHYIEGRVLDQLPRNLHMDQRQRQQESSAAENQSALLDTLTEEDEQELQEDDNEDDEGLVVAWQYRKDVQEERLGLVSSLAASGSGNSGNSSSASNATTARSMSSLRSSSRAVFCHSYDFQGRLAKQINVASITSAGMLSMRRPRFTDKDRPQQACMSDRERRQCGYSYYQQLISAVHAQLHGKARVVRLLLYHTDVSVLVVTLPLFLHYIRLHKLPVVVMVSAPPHCQSLTFASLSMNMSEYTQYLFQLQRCSDVVLSCESFATRRHYPPPAEFHKLHGLLAVKRAATCTLASSTGHFADATVDKRPTATLYGLRRDARKLHVSLLHIPPEDHAADGSSVGAFAVRSGGGLPPSSSTRTSRTATTGCASSSGGNSPLDF